MLIMPRGGFNLCIFTRSWSMVHFIPLVELPEFKLCFLCPWFGPLPQVQLFGGLFSQYRGQETLERSAEHHGGGLFSPRLLRCENQQIAQAGYAPWIGRIYRGTPRLRVSPLCGICPTSSGWTAAQEVLQCYTEYVPPTAGHAFCGLFSIYKGKSSCHVWCLLSCVFWQIKTCIDFQRWS